MAQHHALAAPAGTRAPLTHLVLPFKVDTHLSIATLEWQGTTALTATDLAGHYVFDSTTHRLNAGHGRISSGKYDFSATLQATAPMAIAAQVQGTVLPFGIRENMTLTSIATHVKNFFLSRQSEMSEVRRLGTRLDVRAALAAQQPSAARDSVRCRSRS